MPLRAFVLVAHDFDFGWNVVDTLTQISEALGKLRRQAVVAQHTHLRLLSATDRVVRPTGAQPHIRKGK